MTKVNWYNVGNAREIEKKDIPQVVTIQDLEDLGMTEIVFIVGVNLSIIFKGEVLTPNLNGKNPFYKERATAYIDPITKEIWVGYAVEM